ncbi:MAG: glutathione S-transferase family protein [Pseudomonadota bacterium]
MLLDPDDITTKDVLSWQGLHLLHFDLSSCSQKVRIVMRELGIDFTSHPINLVKGENRSSWYLGINTRGLVPVLVHDGAVHIESNDIISYLDETFAKPGASLRPQTDVERNELQALMDMEDARHADLREVTFTYLAPARTAEAKVGAKANPDPDLSFLGRMHAACATLDTRLARQPYLLGVRLTLADIAWYITLHRLDLAGYPMNAHPHLASYLRGLDARESFRIERSAGPALLRAAGSAYRNVQRWFGRSLKNDLTHQLQHPSAS